MIDIEEIGYFKYKTHNSLIVDCIKEFPITEEIKEFLKSENNFDIESSDGQPKKIYGKLVALI
jgi:invasion protein IalB